MRICLAVLAFAFFAMFTLPVEGQLAKKMPQISDASIDLSVPDSPAFNVLGLAPNDVDRPSSPRELVASLLNGVDANGNFQTGVALDVSPYMLVYGGATTLEDYQKHRNILRNPIRLVSRTQISFATAKGVTEDDEAVRIAVGARITPWDEGDPRMDLGLLECLKAAVREVEISQERELLALLDERNQRQKDLQQSTDPQEKAKLEGIIEQLEKRIQDLRKSGEEELNKKSGPAIQGCRNNRQFRSNLWNKSSWSLCVAPTFTSTTGKTKDFESSGVALWTSLALKLPMSQLLLHTRYRTEEQVPNDKVKGQFFEQDSIRFGSRLRIGAPDFHLNLELSYVIADRKNGQRDDNMLRYSAGLDFRIAPDLWLNFNVGSEEGNKNGDKIFVLGNFKWAFSPQPALKF